MENFTIVGLTPFETTDSRLTLDLEMAGAFPVLHLGRDRDAAIAAITEVAEKCKHSFGICLAGLFSPAIDLPPRLSQAIAPYGLELSLPGGIRVFRHVLTLEQ